jgi:hypothetical protein
MASDTAYFLVTIINISVENAASFFCPEFRGVRFLRNDFGGKGANEFIDRGSKSRIWRFRECGIS